MFQLTLSKVKQTLLKVKLKFPLSMQTLLMSMLTLLFSTLTSLKVKLKLLFAMQTTIKVKLKFAKVKQTLLKVKHTFVKVKLKFQITCDTMWKLGEILRFSCFLGWNPCLTRCEGFVISTVQNMLLALLSNGCSPVRDLSLVKWMHPKGAASHRDATSKGSVPTARGESWLFIFTKLLSLRDSCRKHFKGFEQLWFVILRFLIADL